MSDATLLAFPQRPEDRLRLALRRLEEGLDEQRQAVACWRAGLADLAAAMKGLDATVTAYRAELDGLAAATRQARAEARRLERTADRMLALAAIP